MTALQIARENIHEACRDEIRRLSVVHVRVSLETALDNWQYLFTQCRFREARQWWAIVEQLRAQH